MLQIHILFYLITLCSLNSNDKNFFLKEKEVFHKLANDRLIEKTELTSETIFNDLVYYSKLMSRKRFLILMKSRTKLFEKTKTVNMKLEKAKKYQFVFKLTIKETKCRKSAKKCTTKY